MRKLWTVICLAVLACCISTAAAQTVHDEMDRFTGQRKIDYTSGAPVKFGVPQVSITARVGGQTPINAVRFLISPEPGRYARQDMKYLGCRRIDWLVDGQPYPLGMVVHDVKRFDRVLVEFLSQEISTEQLAALGAAGAVEYRLCGVTEGRFSVEDIAAARNIAEKIGVHAPALVTPEPNTQTSEPKPSPAPAMKYRPKVP